MAMTMSAGVCPPALLHAGRAARQLSGKCWAAGDLNQFCGVGFSTLLASKALGFIRGKSLIGYSMVPHMMAQIIMWIVS